jgi:hypothetical protein
MFLAPVLSIIETLWSELLLFFWHMLLLLFGFEDCCKLDSFVTLWLLGFQGKNGLVISTIRTGGMFRICKVIVSIESPRGSDSESLVGVNHQHVDCIDTVVLLAGF